MNDMEKMIDPIEEVPGFGNGPDAWARWRRFLETSDVDKRQTEAVRYHKEVGKTPEDVKKESARARGNFAKMLEDEINKNGGA
ncbi:hypothetical protein IJG92_02685 [Candidatus Saccharibacteria bacterium]|nr:hypothetical protein [Candidatus Saccharibacteria bacterium]